MKTRILKFNLLFLLCVIFISCQKDEIDFYNTEYNAIRFPFENKEQIKEPTGYNEPTKTFMANLSFIERPLISDTIYKLPVILIGNVADFDRKILFKIDEEKSNAPAGSYEIVEAVVPAGQIRGYISFKIYNVEELSTKTYNLNLELQPSDGLLLGPSSYISSDLSWNSSIPFYINNNFIRTYNVLINSNLSYISTSMVNYSPRAFRTIVTALEWYDWGNYEKWGVKYNGATYDYYNYLPRFSVIVGDNSYKSYAFKLAKYIEKYNEEHPDAPLVHDAGALIGQRIQARTY